jgi:hypothetical protein
MMLVAAMGVKNGLRLKSVISGWRQAPGAKEVELVLPYGSRLAHLILVVWPF